MNAQKKSMCNQINSKGKYRKPNNTTRKKKNIKSNQLAKKSVFKANQHAKNIVKSKQLENKIK